MNKVNIPSCTKAEGMPYSGTRTSGSHQGLNCQWGGVRSSASQKLEMSMTLNQTFIIRLVRYKNVTLIGSVFIIPAADLEKKSQCSAV